MSVVSGCQLSLWTPHKVLLVRLVHHPGLLCTYCKTEVEERCGEHALQENDSHYTPLRRALSDIQIHYKIRMALEMYMSTIIACTLNVYVHHYIMHFTLTCTPLHQAFYMCMTAILLHHYTRHFTCAWTPFYYTITPGISHVHEHHFTTPLHQAFYMCMNTISQSTLHAYDTISLSTL